MKTVILLRLLPGVLLLGSLAGASDLSVLMSQANRAWLERDYPRSQAVFSRIVNSYGVRAKQGLFGPKFGVVYYRKGLTELKLAHAARRAGREAEAQKWFAEAAESFRICHEDFPNDKKRRGAKPPRRP